MYILYQFGLLVHWTNVLSDTLCIFQGIYGAFNFYPYFDLECIIKMDKFVFVHFKSTCQSYLKTSRKSVKFGKQGRPPFHVEKWPRAMIPRWSMTRVIPCHGFIFHRNRIRKIEKVPRGIRGEKSSKDMASSRNLVSTIGALASPKMGDGTRCPEG